MRLRALAAPPAVQRRTPDLELVQQMRPLVLQLPAGASDTPDSARWPDLATIESKAAGLGLCEHRPKIGSDGGPRRPLCLEANQLRMMAIAPGPIPQHGLRQQAFAPQRDQALRVEVAGMNAPEPQGFACEGTAVQLRGSAPSQSALPSGSAMVIS